MSSQRQPGPLSSNTLGSAPAEPSPWPQAALCPGQDCVVVRLPVSSLEATRAGRGLIPQDWRKASPSPSVIVCHTIRNV